MPGEQTGKMLSENGTSLKKLREYFLVTRAFSRAWS